MDPSLLLGAMLVGVGLALAALAYSLITERTGAEVEKEDPSDSAHEPSEETSDSDVILAETQPVETTSEDISEQEPLPSPAGEAEPVMDATGDEIDDEEEPESIEEATAEPSVDQSEPAPKPEPPKQRPTFPVATLMRDEVSGELAIKVGDKTYRTKEELQASKDWSRVRFAADDLVKWIEGAPTGDKNVPPPLSRRPSVSKAERGKESEVPKSMVEEINDILQEMLLESRHTERAVRLMEGPGGMARVLIGIDSYSIEEVPDAEIRDLIKQAVAQWEATR